MPQHSAVWGYASRLGRNLVKMLDEELKVLGLLHVGDGEIGHVPETAVAFTNAEETRAGANMFEYRREYLTYKTVRCFLKERVQA